MWNSLCPYLTPKFRFRALGIIFTAILVAAVFRGNVRDFISAFGTVFVAIFAIWKDELLNFFNPASVDFDGIPQWDPDPQWPGNQLAIPTWERRENVFSLIHSQYHLVVKNLNPGRPLEKVAVTFNHYRIDEELYHVAVARQFTWAPHEFEERYCYVPDSKTLDLFYRDMAPPHMLKLIIYSGSTYRGGEVKFNYLEGRLFVFYLKISAANLHRPVYRALTITVDELNDLQFSLTPCTPKDWA